MNIEYSQGIIKSPDIYNQSIEELLEGTKSDCIPSSRKFASYGEGVACKSFFMGKVNTNHVKEIIVNNLNSYILTIPIEGSFNISNSGKKSTNISGVSAALSLPTDKIVYTSCSNFIKDYEVFINPSIINPILEKKFNITNFGTELFELDVKTDKVKAIIQFIESSIGMLNHFEEAEKSLSFKNNLQEIISFMLVDLIGEETKSKSRTNNNLEQNLVLLAEEFIDAKCETVFNIQQVADKLFTTPRNIQIAFKKYRSYTPMQFVKSRKLHKAYKNIISSNDPRCTVKEIALDVGMFDLNRFSKYYFEIFKELPSQTLKRRFEG